MLLGKLLGGLQVWVTTVWLLEMMDYLLVLLKTNNRCL